MLKGTDEDRSSLAFHGNVFGELIVVFTDPVIFQHLKVRQMIRVQHHLVCWFPSKKNNEQIEVMSDPYI